MALSFTNAFLGIPMPLHNGAAGGRIVAPTASTLTDTFSNVWSFGALDSSPGNDGIDYIILQNAVQPASSVGIFLQLVSSRIWAFYHGHTGVDTPAWYIFDYGAQGFNITSLAPTSVNAISQNYVFPGAVQPKVTSPAVLSYTNGFPGIAIPQHKSGLSTVQNYRFPGALQPVQVPRGAGYPTLWRIAVTVTIGQ